MGVSVEGQKCPVCGAYIFDEDDIVFCPECGAPHHRECYSAVGHCALGEFHGTEKEYRRPEKSGDGTRNDEEFSVAASPFEKTEHESTEKTEGESTENNRQRTFPEILCPSCNKKIPLGSTNCPHCGAPVPVMYTSFGRPVNLDPLGGVPVDAKLENGVTAKEVANYTIVNTRRYVPKFFTLNKKKRTSWNWAAFLFPNAWYFYRKAYFPGTLFFILSVVASLLVSAINYCFSNVTFTTTNQMTEYILQHPEIMNSKPMYICMAGMALNIIIRVISGIFGDWIYRNSALERISSAKQDIDSELDENVRIQRKGGVNLFLGLIMYMAVTWVASIIMMFI